MQSNDTSGISRWWRVAGGLSMNLALGTLYGWSVFVAPLEARFGWKRADTSMVFTIAVIVFALSFVVAGRVQDRYGPLARANSRRARCCAPPRFTSCGSVMRSDVRRD